MSLFKKMETTTPHQATLYHQCIYTNNPHEPIYAYMTFYEPTSFFLFIFLYRVAYYNPLLHSLPQFSFPKERSLDDFFLFYFHFSFNLT